jgi:SAM-dependent methyltransferase
VSFDDFSERYARFNELRDVLIPGVNGWLRAHLPGGRRAVDLGCGEGRHTRWLAERYEQVLAVDVSVGMLRLARARNGAPNVRYERRSVLDVTAERDGAFDAVLSVNTLHHVGLPAAVLPHVRGLLAPGGRLVVVDIVDTGGWGDRDRHIVDAFAAARGLYRLAGGDPDAAADVLRLLLHPRWLDMMVADRPPTREELHRHAAAALPGVVFEDGLHPVMCGLAWRKEGAPPH